MIDVRVVVVIHGGVRRESENNREKIIRGRVSKGIELVKEGKAKIILFFGSGNEVKYVEELARKHGIEITKRIDDLVELFKNMESINYPVIYIDTRSKHTVDNAYYAKKVLSRLLEQSTDRKIGLVTSNYHMERAYKVFEWVLNEDFSITKIPVDDNPSEETLKREEKLKNAIPIMECFFKKGDAEHIKKAVDITLLFFD